MLLEHRMLEPEHGPEHVFAAVVSFGCSDGASGFKADRAGALAKPFDQPENGAPALRGQTALPITAPSERGAARLAH